MSKKHVFQRLREKTGWTEGQGRWEVPTKGQAPLGSSTTIQVHKCFLETVYCSTGLTPSRRRFQIMVLIKQCCAVKQWPSQNWLSLSLVHSQTMNTSPWEQLWNQASLHPTLVTICHKDIMKWFSGFLSYPCQWLRLGTDTTVPCESGTWVGYGFIWTWPINR